MNPGHAADVSLLVLRIGLGMVFFAHGYNHIVSGGRIAETARWFEPRHATGVHVWLASLSELAAGISLVLWFLTPLGCAAAVGTMIVAWITNHRRNGFFISSRRGLRVRNDLGAGSDRPGRSGCQPLVN